jgi:hypothetical protein
MTEHSVSDSAARESATLVVGTQRVSLAAAIGHGSTKRHRVWEVHLRRSALLPKEYTAHRSLAG